MDPSVNFDPITLYRYNLRRVSHLPCVSPPPLHERKGAERDVGSQFGYACNDLVRSVRWRTFNQCWLLVI